MGDEDEEDDEEEEEGEEEDAGDEEDGGEVRGGDVRRRCRSGSRSRGRMARRATGNMSSDARLGEVVVTTRASSNSKRGGKIGGEGEWGMKTHVRNEAAGPLLVQCPRAVGVDT